MDNRRPTQADRVIDYMKQFGSISSLEAFSDLGVTRLSARIWEIRHDKGYKIKAKSETTRNRFGEKVTYFRYSIIEG